MSGDSSVVSDTLIKKVYYDQHVSRSTVAGRRSSGILRRNYAVYFTNFHKSDRKIRKTKSIFYVGAFRKISSDVQNVIVLSLLPTQY
jgi:hypothetical protein